MTRILVIDDEAGIQESLFMFLLEKGFEVRVAQSLSEGMRQVEDFRPKVVILDLRLPDGNGLDALKPLSEMAPHAKTVVITAFHDMETTIEAMRRGAYDYIHKPIDVDELDRAIDRAVRVAELGSRTPPLIDTQPFDAGRVQLVGRSSAMKDIFKTIGLLAGNRASVLIEGETGTGKEVIARIIHDRSAEADQPFVVVDCTTLVDTLMESELFGHEKGAFTGAVSSKKGRLELAGRGTIFFDEISELPAPLQAKLLRFLERREFTRLGGLETRCSQARIVAAANRNLEDLSRCGRFRADLLYRLKVMTIKVPPLRSRIEDLEEMVPYFLRRINADLGTNVTRVEPGAMKVLRGYSWPGNVRELVNVLTKAVLESRGPVILADTLKAFLDETADRARSAWPGPKNHAAEKDRIVEALNRTGWNISAASRILGLSRPTLRKRLAGYGLHKPE
ncbi:MAG: sigma-54 dependent transcriptional regulator [Thermodesulfobacteriota bacterium]